MTRHTALKSAFTLGLATVAVVSLVGCSASPALTSAPAPPITSPHGTNPSLFEQPQSAADATRGAQEAFAERLALEEEVARLSRDEAVHLAEEALSERQAVEDEALRHRRERTKSLAEEALAVRQAAESELLGR